MTEATDAINAVRAVLAEGGRGDVRGALDTTAFADAQVVTAPDSDLVDHVIVTLTDPVPLGDLEEAFGVGRELPRRPSPSAHRQVLFEATLPAEGSVGGTVLAELGEDGRVERVVVRRDEL